MALKIALKKRPIRLNMACPPRRKDDSVLPEVPGG
jgi:hypothetical protein